MSANRSSVLKLASSILVFAASTSVAISVVGARMSKSKAKGQVTVITPSSAAGVSVTPAADRALSVDSVPEGAIVSVAGTVLGQTPFTMTWPCKSGDAVSVQLERPGFAQRTVVVGCQDGHTRISAKLDAR